MSAPIITLIGGPTALIEAGGFRLLTDPTFDAPGEYNLPHVTLKKTSGPALTAEQIGPVHAVLLSHDQHADNFDHAARSCRHRAVVGRCHRLHADLRRWHAAHLYHWRHGLVRRRGRCSAPLSSQHCVAF